MVATDEEGGNVDRLAPYYGPTPSPHWLAATGDPQRAYAQAQLDAERLLGTYKDGVLIEAGGQASFPLKWLQDTPFSDYTMPALILAIGVGGSSLIAAVLVFTGREEGALASLVAGLAMSGFIVGEVVMLKQRISWVEALYFGLGLLISGLAAYLWMVEFRRRHFHRLEALLHTSKSLSAHDWGDKTHRATNTGGISFHLPLQPRGRQSRDA